jgi:hypothetical protein
MNRPLTFAYRNVLFGRDARDAWALFRLHTSTYAGLSLTGKIEMLGRLAAYATAVDADFQVLRVTRTWSGADYAEAAHATLDGRY